MEPKVSIIMATYNRAHLITETLECISNQSFKNWECLIIDDGSEDNTADVVREFSSNDVRFLYLNRHQNYRKGLPGCRNQGIDIARGEFIIFFDDDDIPHPQLLELAAFELNNFNNDFCRYERGIFSGQFKYNFNHIQDYRTTRITIKNIEHIIKNELPFNSCQILWKRSSIGQMRFVESLLYAEEWEFYSRLLINGLEGISIDKVLYFGRKHPKSNTREFQQRNPIRLNSQNQAAILIIENLSLKNLFSKNFKLFFLRMGFELDSLEVIKKSLKAADSTTFENLKYQIGYKFYPVLKPIFYLKGKILKD